ncbi:50S ribosomal protein L29 [Candidatus Phytoplasma tritici]|uniref:50S ribosomal protein L29 n=1 Tax=Candidatus Phytoplasma tritici TaxID=321961 RepID=UPI0004109B9A
MKNQEILKLNPEELENKVDKLKQELFDLRFQLALGKLTNTSKIKKLKKTIARIKTILTKKSNQAQTDSTPTFVTSTAKPVLAKPTINPQPTTPNLDDIAETIKEEQQ